MMQVGRSLVNISVWMTAKGRELVLLFIWSREQTWTPCTLEDQTHMPVPGRRGKLRNVSSLTG